MRLTKEEQTQLTREVLDDLPEDFALLSPWISIWLANIFVSIAGIGTLTVLLQEEHSVPIPKALGFGLAATLFLCIANFVITQGYRTTGTTLVKAIAYTLTMAGVISLVALRELNILAIGLMGFGLTSILLSHSKYFFVFTFHRAKMMAWARERIQKNKDFKAQILKQRDRK